MTLHVNSNPDGGDVVVVTGVTAIARGQRPSGLGAYLDKYEISITGPLGMTVDEIDRTYDTEIRIRPRPTDGHECLTSQGPRRLAGVGGLQPVSLVVLELVWRLTSLSV